MYEKNNITTASGRIMLKNTHDATIPTITFAKFSR